MIYFNDLDKTACSTIREMMAVGMIQPGYVDERSIADVQPHELVSHKRVHLFAGIGGFEIAAQLAGWPDDRQLWTGGFPCQPFSLAGQRKGCGDDRYLWPEFFRLIRDCRPEFVLVENVPGIDDAANMVLDRVCVDLESVGYEVWPAEIPACAVDAAHIRNRVWIVAYCSGERRWGTRQPSETVSQPGTQQRLTGCSGGAVAHASGSRSLPATHRGIYRGEEGPRPWHEQSERLCGSIVANRHEPGPQEHVARQDGGEREAVERSCRRSVGNAADKCGGEVRTEVSGEHERALGGPGVRALGDSDRARELQPNWGIGDKRRRNSYTSGGALAWVQHPLDQRFRRVPLDLLDPAQCMADGVFPRAPVLHSLGNSIVPSIAKEILQAMIRATS